MKTQIQITGQVNGNSYLKDCIITADCEVKRNFANYTIEFPTKAKAVEALNKAIKRVKNEDGQDPNFSYTRDYSLNYDASRAVIEN